jgi:RNA polymerase sigma factor, sigma-70 family
MEELLKTNLDTIFNYALFITGNREKALDLMQDTIVTVLSKKHLYKEEEHFKSWIFRILKNNFINKIKHDSILGEISFSEFAKDDENGAVIDFPDAGISPDELSDPILKEKIREAFEKMPEEYREVIVMIHIDGLSYEETAQTLEIPVGTVMSRLHRGRNFLKKALGKEAEELQIVEKKDRKNA